MRPIRRPARLVGWTLIVSALLLTLAAVIVLTVFPARVRGAAFVVRAAGLQGAVRTVADWDADEVSEGQITIPSRTGNLPARRYLPRTVVGRTFLLVPGVHASGVDEPRLVGFARDLAASGHPVVTVGPPDLASYAISSAVTDAIEDAAHWVAAQRALAPDGRIGMMGISFAGGLSLVAAGRPSLRENVAVVLSLGGHGDLPRTLRYLCTGQHPGGTSYPPHDYGVVIILLRVLDRMVPQDQVEGLRAGVLTFLDASRLDLVDKGKSAEQFQRALALETSMPEPSRTLMRYVNQRDVAHLGPLLLPHIDAMQDDPALSPSLASPPSAPVYLLHGLDDNVIPAAESIMLAETLREKGARVHVLATPLITHAEVDRGASAGDVWRLIELWGNVMAQ